LLGILARPCSAYFQSGGNVEPAEIEQLIEQRNAARRAGDFARADEIRDALINRGIELEDTRDGTRWKVRGA